MDIGTGIFLSSLFLGTVGLFVVTKERWNWKKIILWPLGLAVIGGVVGSAGVYISYLYENWPTKQTAYMGLSLGMTQSEVRYVKGKAEKTPETPGAWVYFSGYKGKSILIVFFASNSKQVNRIVCQSETSVDCDGIFGLYIGTSEKRVFERLGEPTKSKINGEIKKIDYQNLNLRIVLLKQKIHAFVVTDRSDIGGTMSVKVP
jgi:hypothetical protein